MKDLGAKYLVFAFSRSVKMRELFQESVFTFQFLNDKIHSYGFFFT